MSSLVFKVKYEDTLRRFNVAISGDRRLDLSMDGLRLKVSSLFNLPPDFCLTYEDEDDDLVTLVDDEDLHDLVRQGLNPVRIFVHLNSDQEDQSSAAAPSIESAAQRPSRNVEPNSNPNVPETSKSVPELRSSTSNYGQSPNPDVVEVMKSIQEPLAQALSKLSSDMSSKAASTYPALTDLFDGLLKIGQECVNAALSNSGSTSVSSNVDGDNELGTNSDGRKQNCSVNDDMQNGDIDTAIPAEPTPKSNMATGVPDKGKNASTGSSSNMMSTTGAKKGMFAKKKGLDGNAEFLRLNAVGASGKKSKKAAADKTRGFQSHSQPIPLDECHIAGTPVTRNKNFQPVDRSYRGFYNADSVVPVIHKNVRCDGCGVQPITGSRFKSNVKINYDLCSLCYLRFGNDVDYTRIDYPLAYRHPLSFKTIDAKSSCPYVTRSYMPENPRSRFDSRFIMDVTVMDGTTMAPATPFIKIWRMRNNGKVPWCWNHGFKLLWVGGDRFSPSDSAEIKVPSTGVNVASDLDIAVNFIAPDLPGSYISYWRMVDPYGIMFGQRVWVQIQVDSSLNLTRDSFPMLDLNLLPESNETAFSHEFNVKSEPGLSVEGAESSAPFAPKQKYSNLPINNDLLAAKNLVYPFFAAPSLSVPQVSSTDRPVSPGAPYHVPEASAPLESYPTIDVGSNIENNSGNGEQVSKKSEFKNSDIEEKMLKELEQMGFKQNDLNKEVLRMNDYDLERSVDDLCDVSEWDPILEELHVMGFKDKELNKKLLVKNNGSISRVVIDLIADD